MAGLVTLVVVAHLGMAAVDLPGLWGRHDKRREFWAVVALLLIGVALAMATVTESLPVSAFKLIQWIVEPIGTLLFKTSRG